MASFALLFGTTWVVNALVFAGVLVTVLAAVEVTRHLRTPPLRVVYGGVLAALALAWVVRPEWLLGLPLLPRLVTATVLAFLPIFLANMAFAKRFAATADSQEAFGVNLLGAIVGGCLEYVALLTGYAEPADRGRPALPPRVPAAAEGTTGLSHASDACIDRCPTAARVVPVKPVGVRFAPSCMETR